MNSLQRFVWGKIHKKDVDFFTSPSSQVFKIEGYQMFASYFTSASAAISGAYIHAQLVTEYSSMISHTPDGSYGDWGCMYVELTTQYTGYTFNLYDFKYEPIVTNTERIVTTNLYTPYYNNFHNDWRLKTDTSQGEAIQILEYDYIKNNFLIVEILDSNQTIVSRLKLLVYHIMEQSWTW